MSRDLLQLVDFYPGDADVQHLVDTYDWYLMPVVNPDGYTYTWASVSRQLLLFIMKIVPEAQTILIQQ